MGNEIAVVNGVAFGSVAKVNGVETASITHINGMDLVVSVDPSFTTAYTDVEFSGSAIDDDRNGEVVRNRQ